MRKQITINGVDFTDYFTDGGYSVAYKKITGNNGGVMQDGSTVEDILAVKAYITLPLMPLTGEQIYLLLQTVYGSDYATIRYFDPRANGYRTIECIYYEVVGTYGFVNVKEQEMWKAGTLQFTER